MSDASFKNDLLLIGREVILVRNAPKLIVYVVFRLVYKIAERVRALCLYILVRVLRAAHRQHLYLDIELFQKPYRTLRGFFPRAVVIVGDDDLIGVMRYEPRLLRRE